MEKEKSEKKEEELKYYGKERVKKIRKKENLKRYLERNEVKNNINIFFFYPIYSTK